LPVDIIVDVMQYSRKKTQNVKLKRKTYANRMVTRGTVTLRHNYSNKIDKSRETYFILLEKHFVRILGVCCIQKYSPVAATGQGLGRVSLSGRCDRFSNERVKT